MKSGAGLRRSYRGAEQQCPPCWLRHAWAACPCALQRVRRARLQRTQQALAAAALAAKPTFCGPLVEIGGLLARLRAVQVCAATAVLNGIHRALAGFRFVAPITRPDEF